MELVAGQLHPELLRTLDQEATNRGLSRNELLRELLDSNRRLERIKQEYATQLSDLEIRISGLQEAYEEQIREYVDRIEEQEHQLSVYESRIEQYTDRVEQYEANLERYEKKIADLERKATRLENEKRLLIEDRQAQRELLEFIDEERARRGQSLRNQVKHLFGRFDD